MAATKRAARAKAQPSPSPSPSPSVDEAAALVPPDEPSASELDLPFGRSILRSVIAAGEGSAVGAALALLCTVLAVLGLPWLPWLLAALGDGSWDADHGVRWSADAPGTLLREATGLTDTQIFWASALTLGAFVSPFAIAVACDFQVSNLVATGPVDGGRHPERGRKSPSHRKNDMIPLYQSTVLGIF